MRTELDKERPSFGQLLAEPVAFQHPIGEHGQEVRAVGSLGIGQQGEHQQRRVADPLLELGHVVADPVDLDASGAEARGVADQLGGDGALAVAHGAFVVAVAVLGLEHDGAVHVLGEIAQGGELFGGERHDQATAFSLCLACISFHSSGRMRFSPFGGFQSSTLPTTTWRCSSA